MTTMARELRSWLALVAVVVALWAGLSIRADPSSRDVAADAGASAEPTASLALPEPMVARPGVPLSGSIIPPTRGPAPSLTDAGPSPMPSGSTAPVAAAPAPTPPPGPTAQAPAPPTPTPVPVHDDEPALLTQERVDGGFGETLTIDGYGVRATRAAVPSANGCLDGGGSDFEVFDVTVTYSGSLADVQFAIARPTESWCIDASGSPSQLFPSGVTRQVIIRYADGYAAADAPLVVWLMPVNGPHTLTFGFH